jgi:hypothetical protein
VKPKIVAAPTRQTRKSVCKYRVAYVLLPVIKKRMVGLDGKEKEWALNQGWVGKCFQSFGYLLLNLKSNSNRQTNANKIYKSR